MYSQFNTVYILYAGVQSNASQPSLKSKNRIHGKLDLRMGIMELKYVFANIQLPQIRGRQSACDFKVVELDLRG
jgi:hypothetical protein